MIKINIVILSISQIQIIETGIYKFNEILDKIFNRYFTFSDEISFLSEQRNVITLGEFYRNCLILHISIILIAIIFLLLEIESIIKIISFFLFITIKYRLKISCMAQEGITKTPPPWEKNFANFFDNREVLADLPLAESLLLTCYCKMYRLHCVADHFGQTIYPGQFPLPWRSCSYQFHRCVWFAGWQPWSWRSTPVLHLWSFKNVLFHEEDQEQTNGVQIE